MTIKNRIYSFLIVFTLILTLISCSCTSPETKAPLKAAIIDQLGTDYPNEYFIREVTDELAAQGFTLTVFTGDEITVDLYKKLPTYGFQVIIFRVHTNPRAEETASQGKTFLYTNEPYDDTKYITLQLADWVVPARLDENSPRYFAVSSDFISHYSRGYDKSVIVMMGCAGLLDVDMAEDFISNGALLYTGWTASVKLDFVDDFTIALIKNLCLPETTFKEALYQTAQEKGIEPTYKSVFSYYPQENEGYSLADLK